MSRPSTIDFIVEFKEASRKERGLIELTNFLDSFEVISDDKNSSIALLRTSTRNYESGLNVKLTYSKGEWNSSPSKSVPKKLREYVSSFYFLRNYTPSKK